MAETIVLDPSAAGEPGNGIRTQLDITSYVDEAGPDWGDAQIEAYMAEGSRGQIPVDYRVPNRTITIPLNLRVVGATSFETIRANLQAKAGLFQTEGGWLKRTTSIGTVFADVVNASLKLGGSFLQAFRSVDIDAVLTLECRPDFYAAEIDLGDNVETTAKAIVFTETGIKGDYPGRVRIVIDDDSGQNQLGTVWGMRSRYYDAAATAGLQHEAEALEALDTTTTAALTGASGGNVRQRTLATTNWLPVISTTSTGGLWATHMGAYRIWARVHTPSGGTPSTVQVRLAWNVGSMTGPFVWEPAEEINRPIRIPTANNFHLVDLGEVHLHPAPMSGHRWRGIIEAKGDAGGETIRIDWVAIVPISEGYGAVRGMAASPAIYNSQSLEARTEGVFREASGGGNWGPGGAVNGSLPRMPASGLEGRTVQFIVFNSRGDLAGAADSAIDDLSVRVFYRPCWLSVPVA